jgi:hypothetical protein
MKSVSGQAYMSIACPSGEDETFPFHESFLRRLTRDEHDEPIGKVT